MGLELASPELTDSSKIKEEAGFGSPLQAVLQSSQQKRSGYWGGPIEDGPMEFEGASNGARVNPP
jgi:hypothetical protein